MSELPPLPAAVAAGQLGERRSPVLRPGLTEGADSRPDLDPQTDPRTFPCDQCGADLEYAIGREALRCRHCGYSRDIEVEVGLAVAEQEYEATLRRIEELRRNQAEGHAGEERVRCESCAAEVVFHGTVTSTQCAYCGQDVQRDRVHTATDRIPVDGVIPFAVDRGEAQRLLTKWLKKLWFAPGAFVRQGLRGKFEGVYLPYFSFDTLTFTSYVGQRGTHHTVRSGSGKNARTRTETRWQRVQGKFQRFFDDVLTLGLEHLDIPQVRRLEPWPLERLRPFRAEYVAGFGARTYDRDLEPCFVEARKRIDAALDADVRQRIGGDEQRIEHLDVRYDAITYKHLLLPLWLMHYSYGGKSYRVILNAVTGEVFGERPWSFWKIVLFGLAAAILVAVLIIVFR